MTEREKLNIKLQRMLNINRQKAEKVIAVVYDGFLKIADESVRRDGGL